MKKLDGPSPSPTLGPDEDELKTLTRQNSRGFNPFQSLMSKKKFLGYEDGDSSSTQGNTSSFPPPPSSTPPNTPPLTHSLSGPPSSSSSPATTPTTTPTKQTKPSGPEAALAGLEGLFDQARRSAKPDSLPFNRGRRSVDAGQPPRADHPGEGMKDVILTGWVKKKRIDVSTFSRWKKRFLYLTENSLWYHADPKVCF